MERKHYLTDFELKQKELLKKSEISLWIESYDDIYSDFDPRPNYQRALSQDFLDETKRAVRNDEGDKTQLNILMEEKLRDKKEEDIIAKRLEEHFQKHYHLQRKERLKIRRKGIIFIILGILFLFLAAFLIFEFSRQTNWVNFLLVVLEPAGWFFAWEGLNVSIFRAGDITPDYEFYKKMSTCEVKFDSY
jgi:hypothetical protein